MREHTIYREREKEIKRVEEEEIRKKVGKERAFIYTKKTFLSCTQTHTLPREGLHSFQLSNLRKKAVKRKIDKDRKTAACSGRPAVTLNMTGCRCCFTTTRFR